MCVCVWRGAHTPRRHVRHGPGCVLRGGMGYARLAAILHAQPAQTEHKRMSTHAAAPHTSHVYKDRTIITSRPLRVAEGETCQGHSVRSAPQVLGRA